MPVIVSIMAPGAMGSAEAVCYGQCRVRETITVPGTTTASAQNGEIFVLCSTEAATVLAATGSTPDAQAAAMSSASGAGAPVPPGQIVVFQPRAGDKLNVKALA